MSDKPCRAVVTANHTADVDGVIGFGMPYLVSCSTCVNKSVALEAGRHQRDCRACAHPQPGDPPAWSGYGEAYARTLLTAQRMADNHNTRQAGHW